MKNLNKYLEKIETAIKSIEANYELVIKAKKNIKQKNELENELILIKKEKVSSIELIDQALEEIKLLRNNVIKEKKPNG